MDQNQQPQPTLNDVKAGFADLQLAQMQTFNMLCNSINDRDQAIAKLTKDVGALEADIAKLKSPKDKK